jgi:hypothetical protein
MSSVFVEPCSELGEADLGAELRGVRLRPAVRHGPEQRFPRDDLCRRGRLKRDA